VLAELEKSPSHIRTKRQTADKFDGYSVNIINVSTSNGVVGEIQVNTAKMIYAKEQPEIARTILGDDVYDSISRQVGVEGGRGHYYYELIRIMDSTNPAELKKKHELIEKMSKYYSLFQ
jgi:hypothetical protein